MLSTFKERMTAMSDLVFSSQDNILIVDDVLDNLELLSRILSRRGYTVRSIDNGRKQ